MPIKPFLARQLPSVMGASPMPVSAVPRGVMLPPQRLKACYPALWDM
jgi:hypothetical protein